MATIDLNKNIDELLRNSELFDIAHKEDLIHILDANDLKTAQAIHLMGNLTNKYQESDIINILKHITIDFTDDIKQICTLLNIISKKLGIALFAALSTYLNKPSNPSNDRATNLDDNVDVLDFQMTEDINLLQKYKPEPSNFAQIYKILENAAKNDDNNTFCFVTHNEYIKIRDEFEDNLLLKAADLDNLQLVKKLIDNHADPTVTNKALMNILHYFCRNDNAKAVKELSAYSSLVNAKEYQGFTPLHYACSNGSMDTVKALCSIKGINLNEKDNYGNTPLQSCYSSSIKEYLISLGAV